MHNASFEALGLDYRYLAFDVNEETLPTAVAGLKVLGARGFNLTMPDKNLMVSLCDELSTAARIIGAVNTVVNEDGRLIGHNTDGIGYMQSVKDAGYDIIGKKMTLLGAGGAATAILVQAALDGLKEISVFVRPTSRFYDRLVHTVDELTEITDCRIRICDFSDADLLGVPVRVVVSPRNLKESVVEVSTRDKSLMEKVPVENAEQYVKELVEKLKKECNLVK